MTASSAWPVAGWRRPGRRPAPAPAGTGRHRPQPGGV